MVKFPDNPKIIDDRNKVIIEYTEGRSGRIRSDFKREQAVAKDYRGRELVELLQNAEDAAYEDKKTRGNGRVAITLQGDILIIENTGKPFGYEGIHSLMLADDSPKDPLLMDVIGNKGLGFRAILSWAESIKITSRKVCVEFSKDGVERLEKEILAKRPDLKDEITETSISVLSAPAVDDNGEHNSEYDTRIEIKCKPNYSDENGLITSQIIAKQINEVLCGEVLVFLRYTKAIIVRVNDEPERHFVKEIIDETSVDDIKRTELKINQSNSESAWNYVLYTQKNIITVRDEQKGKDIDKKILLGLALPIGYTLSDNYLYSFFRTKIKNPFSFLLNATFELKQNRNELIDNDESNRKVVSHFIPFIYNALEMYTKGAEDRFALLKNLIITNNLFLKEYAFYDKYIDLIKTKNILPCVNDNYLRPDGVIDLDNNDAPVFSLNNFAEMCKGDNFSDLVLHTADNAIISFIRTLGIKSYKDYKEEYLRENIDKFVDCLTFTNEIEKIELCSRLLHLYTCEFGQNGIYPKLFINSKNERIDAENLLFVVSRDKSLSPPTWLDLEFASQGQIKSLCQLYGKNVADLVTLFSGTPFKLYNFLEIIEVVNQKCKGELTFEQIIELSKWLFSQYMSNPIDFKENVKNLNVKVIYGKKEKPEIAFAREVYFPDHYGNVFVHSLLKGSNCKFLIGKATYGFNGTDNQINEYFYLLGVNKYPRLIWAKLNSVQLDEFFRYLTGSDTPRMHLSNRTNSQYFYNYNIDYQFISLEHIETILKKPFQQIVIFLELFKKDRREVFEWLMNIKQDNCYIKITYDYSYSKYKQTEPITYKNYFKWLFSKTQWVEYLDNRVKKKIAPRNCSFDVIDLHGYFERPHIDIKSIQKESKSILELKDSKSITELTVKALLEQFGAINSISDLNTEDIYLLLETLPNIDKECIVGRRVYDKVFDVVKTDLLGNSTAYKRYKAQCKICAVKCGVKGYYPISTVSYSNNKTLCDEILNDITFFDFPYRKGADKVETIFGVKKLNADAIKICDDNISYHVLNKEFQESFKQIKPFIIVKRKQASSKGQDDTFLKNSDVYLVNRLNVEYQLSSTEIKKYPVSDYSFVYLSKERKGYIVVPNNVFDTSDSLLKNTSFADSLAELICLILTVADGKESYRELIKENNDDREVLLERDLGKNALAILNDVRVEYGIIISKKDAFYTVLKAIIGQNKINSLAGKTEIFDERSFNFENFNDVANFPQIIKLFKHLKIDIPQFNSHCDYHIHIENYLMEQFKELKFLHIERFKTYIYENTIKKESSERIKYYLSAVKNYQFGAIENFKNTVDSQYEEFYESSFGIKLCDLPEAIDFQKVINDNLEKYQAENEEKYNLILRQNIIEYQEYALLDVLELYYEKISQTANPEPKQSVAEDAKIDYGELINNVDNSDISGRINTADIEKTSKNPSQENSQGTNGNNNFGISNEIAKQENGFIAEYFAYKKLAEEYGEVNVNWVSKNSTYETPGKEYEDRLHYDISYTDKGKEHFVEVKKISPDNLSFDITSAEVDFGEANSDRYHIYCVAVSNKKPIKEKSVLIKKFFTYTKSEGFTHNSKFSVITNSFKIKAKIKK